MLGVDIPIKNTGQSHTLEVTPFSISSTCVSSRSRRPATARGQKVAGRPTPLVFHATSKPKERRFVSRDVSLLPVVLGHYPFAGPFVDWDALPYRDRIARSGAYPLGLHTER